MKPLYVALTFDDGYLSNYYVAKILSSMHIKATFFLITHLTKHPHERQALLRSDPDKIRKIFEMGHEIGSHTCTHADLLTISPALLERELKLSKVFLEKLLETEIQAFAYPYGHCDERIIREVRKYYSYARGYIPKSMERERNIIPNDRYYIHGIDKSRVLRILKAKYLSAKLVIVFHNESPVIILLLIGILRSIWPTVRFVALREAVAV